MWVDTYLFEILNALLSSLLGVLTLSSVLSHVSLVVAHLWIRHGLQIGSRPTVAAKQVLSVALEFCVVQWIELACHFMLNEHLLTRLSYCLAHLHLFHVNERVIICDVLFLFDVHQVLLVLNFMSCNSDLFSPVTLSWGTLELDNIVGEHLGFMYLILLHAMVNINLNLILRYLF